MTSLPPPRNHSYGPAIAWGIVLATTMAVWLIMSHVRTQRQEYLNWIRHNPAYKAMDFESWQMLKSENSLPR